MDLYEKSNAPTVFFSGHVIWNSGRVILQQELAELTGEKAGRAVLNILSKRKIPVPAEN
jgi:hypothetical protein